MPLLRRRRRRDLHERPDLRIEMLRGNLDTRLHKLDIGQHDAIVLAAAGLRRLGFAHRISELLPVDHFVPCAGQGALAIESREDDSRVRKLLAPLEHPPTRGCVTAERAVLRAEGHTFGEIAEQLQIDESTARKKMRLLKKTTPREAEGQE